MESAFGAVEISPDEVVFGGVGAVVALFPTALEGFELVLHGLGVRGVGGIVADEAAGGGIDVFGVGFFGPPQDLVHPVDTPIAEGAVGVVEELAEAAGMDGLVEIAIGGGAEPEVPVHAGGRFGVGGFGRVAESAVGEDFDLTDFADLAGFEEFHACEAVGGDAAMEPDLDLASGFAGGADHGAAFVDGVGDGFFDVDVGAGFDGIDGGEGVPVVRRGDDGDVGAFLLEEFAVVLVDAGLIGRDFVDFVEGFGGLGGVGVGEGDGETFAGGEGFAEDVHAPPAGADEGGFVFAAWGLGGEQYWGELEEVTALHADIVFGYSMRHVPLIDC